MNKTHTIKTQNSCRSFKKAGKLTEQQVLEIRDAWQQVLDKDVVIKRNCRVALAEKYEVSARTIDYNLLPNQRLYGFGTAGYTWEASKTKEDSFDMSQLVPNGFIRIVDKSQSWLKAFFDGCKQCKLKTEPYGEEYIHILD